MKSTTPFNLHVYVLISLSILPFATGNIAQSDFFIKELFGINTTYIPYLEFFKLYDKFLAHEDTAGHNVYHFDSSPCISAKDLIYSVFNLSSKALDTDAFKELCPAIIMQADFGYCTDVDEGRRNYTNYTAPDDEESSKRDEQSWYLSFGAITLVNGVSIIILLHLPKKNSKVYPYIHCFLLMFGISALLSDTFLQLLPYALGIQREHTGSILQKSGAITGSTGGGSSFGVASYVWKSLSVLIGLYVITMAEVVMVIGQKGNFGLSGISHLRKKAGKDEVITGTGLRGQVSRTLVREVSNPEIDESSSRRRGTTTNNSVSADSKEYAAITKLVANINNQLLGLVGIADKDTDTQSHKSQINAHGWSSKSVVWMIAISEAVHNFINGCVLGLVFTNSYGLSGGVSTTITIILSEIPHEISDYLVLITYGLSVQNAVFINFISSIFAYLGVTLGVLLGTNWIGFMPWAFAFASGLFIYISLASMLPELKEMPLLEERPLFCLITFTLAFAAGVALMLFLAGFEGSVAKVLTPEQLLARDSLAAGMNPH